MSELVKMSVPLTSSARQINLSKRTRRAGGRRFRVGPLTDILKGRPLLEGHSKLHSYLQASGMKIGSLLLTTSVDPA